MSSSVTIDCFPESAFKYRDTHTIVAVDVIRASTTIVTALSLGRRVIPARTTDDAFIIAKQLDDPLFVGELGGNVPYGFDISNSPALVADRTDNHRPMVFISSSGTRLMLNSAGKNPVYIGCFRNLSAVTARVTAGSTKVAVLGAGTRGQFRREDQMCCAWLAERLVKDGFTPEGEMTNELIERWRDADPKEAEGGRSADFLKRTGQTNDLEFIVAHIDDLDLVPELVDGEMRAAGK